MPAAVNTGSSAFADDDNPGIAMPAELRLYEDVLSNDGEAVLPALPRMIFVVHGTLAAADRSVRDGETLSGEGAVNLKAGSGGATFWRWELVSGDGAGVGAATGRGVVSARKIHRAARNLAAGRLLLRGDSVAFPPGGCAYLHRHQGPGIRCLLEGGIRIDTRGHSTSYGPGGAWYETGPDGVFAQAADRPTRFIRVMILPLCLSRQKLGRISQ